MLIDSSKTLKNFGTGVVDPYLPPAALPLTPESIGTSVPTLSARKCRCSRLRPWSIRCLGNRWSLRLQTLGQWSHPCQQNHRLMADLTVRTLYNHQHPLSTTLIILYTFVVFVLLVFVVLFLYFLFVCCLVCFSFGLSPFYFFTKLSLVTSSTPFTSRNTAVPTLACWSWWQCWVGRSKWRKWRFLVWTNRSCRSWARWRRYFLSLLPLNRRPP